jgi:hypothetical protein
MSDQTTVKVSLPGKRGKVEVTVTDGLTVRDAIAQAAQIMEVPGFEPAAATVDGQTAELDQPVTETDTVVKAVPAARLG